MRGVGLGISGSGFQSKAALKVSRLRRRQGLQVIECYVVLMETLKTGTPLVGWGALGCSSRRGLRLPMSLRKILRIYVTARHAKNPDLQMHTMSWVQVPNSA